MKWSDMKQVYLAGPMTGALNDGADWRLAATAKLGEAGIKAVSPTPMSTYESQFRISPRHSPMVLTVRDHSMATMSDFILANFEGSKIGSIGTAIELGWASEAGVPIIGVVPKSNVHDHPMVLSVLAFRVHTLEEGLRVLQALAGSALS